MEIAPIDGHVITWGVGAAYIGAQDYVVHEDCCWIQVEAGKCCEELPCGSMFWFANALKAHFMCGLQVFGFGQGYLFYPGGNVCRGYCLWQATVFVFYLGGCQLLMERGGQVATHLVMVFLANHE